MPHPIPSHPKPYLPQLKVQNFLPIPNFHNLLQSIGLLWVLEVVLRFDNVLKAEIHSGIEFLRGVKSFCVRCVGYVLLSVGGLLGLGEGKGWSVILQVGEI